MDFEIKEGEYNDLYQEGTLYKYIDWSDVPRRNILSNLEIYFSSLDEFGGDENYILETDLDSLTDETIRQRALQIILTNGDTPTSEKIENMTKNYQKEIKDFIRNDREYMRKNLGIFSLSTRRDIPQMWTMFADDFKGICIGFDSTSLMKKSNASGGGLINYYQKAPELPPPLMDEDTDIASILFEINSLPSLYIEEDEYRLFKFHVPSESQRKQMLPSSIYREIILGSEISITDKNEILKIVSEKIPDIKIYTATYDITQKTVLIS